jgi:hypothetical protein
MFDLFLINCDEKLFRSLGYARLYQIVSVKNLCHKIPAKSSESGISENFTPKEFQET